MGRRKGLLTKVVETEFVLVTRCGIPEISSISLFDGQRNHLLRWRVLRSQVCSAWSRDRCLILRLRLYICIPDEVPDDDDDADGHGD